MITDVITIGARFNGPPRSGNGGYVCGRLARYLDGPATVRLRAPPPLGRELRVEADDGQARLFDGDALLAHATRNTPDIRAPRAPSFAEAAAAARSAIGLERHPVPHCFVCGPLRGAGDGMRILPGRTAAPGVWAAPWVPHDSLGDGSGRVAPEFLWAALDCAGAFAVVPEFNQPTILGELNACLNGSVALGETCVVASWPIAVEGRKRFAGTALYNASGMPVGVARATWIDIAALPGAAAPAREGPGCQ